MARLNDIADTTSKAQSYQRTRPSRPASGLVWLNPSRMEATTSALSEPLASADTVSINHQLMVHSCIGTSRWPALQPERAH